MDLKTLSKLDGWKYTSLHGVDFSEGKGASPAMDDRGDQYVWDRADSVQTTRVPSGNTETLIDGPRASMIEAHKIIVESGATLFHLRLIDAHDERYFAPVHVSVAGGGTYTQLLLTRGGRLMRLATQIDLTGETAHADLRAIHLVGGERHVDQSILMKHLAPHCTSNQNVRYVVDGEARAAFQGKIHVARPAQKTLAYQLCKSLLLSDAAQINTKPELEIYADDVKCSHGATTGTLDENALFYLQSRGIPRGAAQHLLQQAFIMGVLDGLDVPDSVWAFLS